MPSLVIRQLEHPFRSLRLAGVALPLQGWSMPVLMRGEIVHYDGHGEGSAHLRGMELGPTTMEFRWKTRHLNSLFSSPAHTAEGPVADARALVRYAKAMVADEVLVSVTYEGDEQVGFIREVDPEVGNPGEFEVDITFNWARAEGLGAQPRMPQPGDAAGSFAGIASTWGGALTKARLPASKPRGGLSILEDAVGKISGGLEGGSTLLSEVNSGTRPPGAARGGLGESLQRVMEGADELRTLLDLPAGDWIESDDPAALIGAGGFIGELARGAAIIRRIAVLEQRRQALAERTDILGTVTALAGESLQLIAYRTYGSTERWWDIAQFNGLTSSELQAGQSLLLPAISGLAEAA